MTQAPLIGLRESRTSKRISHSREWKILVAASLISGLIVWLGNDPITWALAIGLLAGTAVAVVKADLLHPYTWYTPVFFLYSSFFPILVGLERRKDLGYLPEVCLLEWAALATFVMVVGPARKPSVPPLDLLRRLGEPALPVFWISAVLGVIYFGYLRQAGFTSKLEITLSPSLLIGLGGPASAISAMAFAVILASGLASRRIPYTVIATTLALALAGVLVSGERDVMLRVVLVSVFIVHALYRRIKAREFVVLFFLGLILVAVLGQFRNLLIADTPRVTEIDDPTEKILGGEFSSAALNLEELMEEMEREDLFYGETLWWDVKKVFIPGSLGYSSMTPGRWFNLRRYPGLVAFGGGRGFTIVGEGYMNFGGAGVVIWFILIGLMVKRMYHLSGKSAFWFLAYIVSTTLFLYVIREDFAHLFSRLIKQIFFPLLVILATRQVIGKLGFQRAPVQVPAKIQGLWK